MARVAVTCQCPCQSGGVTYLQSAVSRIRSLFEALALAHLRVLPEVVPTVFLSLRMHCITAFAFHRLFRQLPSAFVGKGRRSSNHVRGGGV